MSFSTLTNIMTMLFCTAVLIQSVRLIRCLRVVKGAAFGEMVAALDTSTTRAKAVLADLRDTLRTDCEANARVIASGIAMREELTVMSGIADAVAERIVEAVAKSNPRTESKPDPTPKLEPTPGPKARTRIRAAPRIVEPVDKSARANPKPVSRPAPGHKPRPPIRAAPRIVEAAENGERADPKPHTKVPAKLAPQPAPAPVAKPRTRIRADAGVAA